MRYRYSIVSFLAVISLLVMTALLQQLRSPNSVPMAAAETSASTQPTCTPLSQGSNPSALSLVDAPVGFSQVIDDPLQYRIYGTTADQLRDQIGRCAPSTDGQAEFTAETSYRITWQYDFRRLDDGKCLVTNPKVGMHIGMTLPVWQPTAASDSRLTVQWQEFMTHLRTHEDGHVALDTQHGQALLADLQSYPPTDCATISAAVEYMVQSNINALNQANDNYDTATGHGATQGAVLPS